MAYEVLIGHFWRQQNFKINLKYELKNKKLHEHKTNLSQPKFKIRFRSLKKFGSYSLKKIQIQFAEEIQMDF